MLQQGTVFIGNYSFNQKDILGKGVTGNVFKGKRTSDNYPVAIKVINLKQNQNDITLSLLETQLKALKMIEPHPNLIRSLDILQDQNFCFIVTELYSGGTLKQLLEKQGCLNSQLSIQIFHKIVSAYCAISDASIIHRDLKPANIMLKQGSLEPVIIDFGFAEIIQTKTVMKAFNVGSPAYMAPEAYTKTLFSDKSDVWSLGVILYEMIMGQTLDDGIETKRYFDILSDNFIAQKIVSFGQIFKQILSQVLRMNAFERISIHKIKYILDKHMIMKLNNPIKSLHSSIQFVPPVKGLKSQPLLMNKSNSFDDKSNKQINSLFQSGHFDMVNSVQSINGSSNLTIFNGNKIQAKQTESRYRVNMMSPVRHTQTKQIAEVNRSIEKLNQFQFRNCIVQKFTTFQAPRRLHTQPIQNSFQVNYQNQNFYTNNQPFKSKQNSRVQTQYHALRPRETNLMSVVPQKQYFNQPQNIIRKNDQLTISQHKIQYPQQPLVLRQTIAEEKKVIKQKSPNPQKFSFKKMTQYQENSNNQCLSQQKHQGGKQNLNLRHHQQMGQSVTQLNFNQNLYSSVHQNPNFITRTHFNQPLNHNIQPHPSVVRRIF